MTRAGYGILLLVALLAAWPIIVDGQDRDADDSAFELRYRKYFIPDAHKGELARGLVPVEAEKVRDLLNEARRRNGQLPPQVQLLRGRYYARFVDQQLVDGLGLIDFQSAAEDSAAIRLSPLNLALGSAVWIDEQRNDAVLGADRLGVHWLQVPRSGKLAVAWSLRGRSSEQGRTDFSVRLPAGAVNQLILALPKGLAVLADDVVVSPWSRNRDELAELPEAFALIEAEQEENWWLLELGSRTEATISVGPDDALPDQRAFVALHRASHYSLFPARLELQADMNFDVLRQSILGLTLDADAGLQLIEARYGEQSLNWVVSPRDGGTGDSYRLHFPQPLSGPNHSLRLVFHADLQMDQPWVLPGVHVADVFWQDERVDLLLAESLVLEMLDPTHCVQTRRSPLPGGGESHEFQCFRADHGLRVQIRPRRPEMTVEGGISVRLDRELVSAQVVADVQPKWGEQFRLQAEIDKPWNVVRVDVEPASMLDTAAGSWRFENGLLEIPLREPVMTGRPVRVKIDATRLAPPERIGLPGAQLQFLHFLDMDASRFLVRLHAPAPLQVHLTNDLLLQRIDPTSLSETELSRLGDSTEGTIFTSDSATSVTARLAQNTPAYVADVTVEVSLVGNEVTESFFIRCAPESLPVSKLRVRLSQRRDAVPDWRLQGSSDERLAARMIADDRNEATDEGELWEIDLPTPLSSVFTLRGERSWELQTAAESITLASVPLAVSQTGRLIVRSFDPLRWENQGLEPLPREVAQDAGSQNAPDDVRALFRYQPAQANHFRLLPPSEDVTAAWIWEAQYVSRVFRDGRVWHEAVWRVQNEGADQIRVRFPQDVIVNAVQVDGRTMPVGGPVRAAIDIPIPKESRFTSVWLRYVTAQPDLTWLGQQRFPLPQPSLTVLHSEWMLLLPSGYRALPDAHTEWLPAATTPSLAERLFGGIAQTDGRGATWPIGDKQQRQAASRLQEFVARLGEMRVDSQTTWEQLAQFLSAMEQTTERNHIWLDAESLAEAGVTPDSSVQADWSSPAPSERVQSLLAAHRLSLISDGRHVLLTSEKTAGRWSEALTAGDAARRFHARPGQWLHNLLQHELHQIVSWQPPSAWKETTADLLWASASPSAELGSSGWSAHVLQFATQRSPEYVQVRVVQVDFLRQVGWSLLLFSFALGWWLFPRYPRSAPLTLALCGATALLLPAAWASWGAGLFLGTLVATLSLFLRPRPADSLTSAGDQSAQRKLLTRLAGLLILLSALQWAHGQEEPVEPPPATPMEKAAPEYPLLIPTDPRGRPVGEYWYLPRPLLDALTKNFESGLRGGEWLLQSAEYEASAASTRSFDDEDRRLFVELVAQLQLHTFAADQIVELPFQRSEVQFTEALLDQVPADNIRWNNTNSAIIVVVPQPGLHQLTMHLAVRRVNPAADIDLALPPAARSTLSLSDIPTAWRVTVPTAQGAELAADADRRRIELGPSSRLTIQTSLPGDTSMPQARVDELLWLRVRPNSVVLDMHLNIESTSGRLDQITLLADPRLRLLPLTAAQPVAGEPQISEGNYQQIVLPLKPSTGPRFSLHATFHVMGSPGVGQVRLPRVETVGMARQRRLLATSRGPTLEFSNIMLEGADAFPIRDFLSAWGTDPETPDSAFEIRGNAAASDQRWVAVSRFVPPITTADQHLLLQAAADRLLCTLDVSLETVGGPIYRRVLEVPDKLRVDKVTLTEGTTSNELRFAISEGNRLTLFLPAPAAARQHLVIEGHVPLRAGEAQPVPVFRMLDAAIDSARVELVRRADVEKIEITGTEQWSRNDAVPPPQPGVGEPGRLIGSWTIPADALSDSQAMLRAIPNQLRGQALMATRLLRRPEGWFADVEYHVQLQRGVLDIVRLEIPAEWEEPLDLVPAYPFEIRPLPGQNRRQLLIRPPAAIDRDFAVTIRGRLSGNGDRLRRVPDVVPLDLEDQLRFLVLPTRMDTQEIVWSTSRLSARPLPPMFRLAQDSREGWESFELGERFHASIQRIERVTGFPLIRLADIRVFWTGHDTYVGLATFDMEPAGSEHCTVQGADEIELLAAFLDGVLVPMTAEHEQRFRVPLGPPQLPQRLELVFRGHLTAQKAGTSVHLDAPWISDFPVARTLWSVRVPWSNGDVTLSSPDSHVTGVRQELVRLETSAAIVDLAFDLAAEGGTSEAESWMRLWAERIRDARSRLWRQSATLNTEEANLIRDRVTAMEELWRSDTQRLGSDIVDALLAGGESNQSLLAPWDLTTHNEVWQLHRMYQGRAPSLVAFRNSSSSDLLQRIVAALLLLVAGCAATMALRRGVRLDVFREYPHACCALLGLAWALFLAPAFFGWILVLLGLAAAIRSPWPKRS